jgi:D-alanyl-D-alanine carboxypeptidase
MTAPLGENVFEEPAMTFDESLHVLDLWIQRIARAAAARGRCAIVWSMLKIRFVAAAVIACSVSFVGSAQTVDTIDPALKARIDRIAAGVMEQRGVPSASVAVVQGGRLVYTHAYGKAHIDPDKAATAEMRYSIGSISKQFTAAAILLLQEQGKLKLDDPVGKYVPGLTRGDEVTIRQVLSHTSGYQDYWPEDYLMTPMMKPTTAQAILDTWAKKPLDFEPGTQWQYSNTNFVIAGMIVEKVSGQKLMEFLADHVFHPLGMKSVWDTDQEKLTQTDATAYIRAALGPLRPAPKEGRNWMFAAGELAMTAHDLALWDASMIARSVLKPESYKEMFTEVKLKDGKGTHYGLGVQVLQRDGKLEIEHSGEVTGFVADNVVLPDDGVAVAVLTNHMAGGAGQIASLTADTVTGTKRPAAEEQALGIYRGLQKGEIDRSVLAPNLNDYFDAQTVADFKTSLGPLGEPLSFRQTGEGLRGGMTFHSFRIVYPSRRLSLTTYAYPDGKLEQYLVDPAD